METSLIETACFLCHAPARTSENPRLGFTYYHCCQCGEMHLSHTFVEKMDKRENLPTRQKLAALVTEWNLGHQNQIIITDREAQKSLTNSKVVIHPYRNFLSSYPETIRDTHDRILLNLANLLHEPGSGETLRFQKFAPLAIFFVTGTTQLEINHNIASRLMELERAGYIHVTQARFNVVNSSLGMMEADIELRMGRSGWLRVGEIADQPRDHFALQAYVSMWFDKSRTMFFDKGIKPAIESAHEPLHKVRAQKLNFGAFDESREPVFSEIENSAYLVADITGQPPSVFYEAGYAQGIGLPVIWVMDRHFRSQDAHTRKFDLVYYDSPSDLAEKLRRRIQATVDLEHPSELSVS